MDISNGEGCRVSIFTQGCNVQCKGCFNFQLWDKTKGKEWTEETKKLVFSLLEPDYILGISWLGGEPSMWADEITELNKEIREKFKDGETRAKIARDYNVSWTLIKFIVTGKNWKHIK